MNIAEAKLFKNGQGQAVRLPKHFRFKGTSVCIKHFGNRGSIAPILLQFGFSQLKKNKFKLLLL